MSMFVSLDKTMKTKHFQSAGWRCWPELQPSVYYFSGCMNRSRKILWRICGHCPAPLSAVINSLTSPATTSVPQSPGGCFELGAERRKNCHLHRAQLHTVCCGDWTRLGLRCWKPGKDTNRGYLNCVSAVP